MGKLAGRGRTATETYPEARPSSGGAPSGPAGGDLDGTYPDPDVVAVQSGVTRLPIGTIRAGSLLGRNISDEIASGLLIGTILVAIPGGVVPFTARQTVVVSLVGTVFVNLTAFGSLMYLLNNGTNQFAGTGDPVVTDVQVTNVDELTVGFINIGGANTSAADLRIWLGLDLLAS